jgi:RNA polymerase sigma-70 factor (ECF subfamily)
MTLALDVEQHLDRHAEAAIRDAWIAEQAGLRAFARRALRDRELADDLAQETFLRAWRNASRFDRSRGTARTWLYAIMRNLVRDVARMHARRPCTSELVDDWPVADDVDAVLGSLTASAALHHLSADHQEVIVQSYVAQRPVAEIAQLLGVPSGTVRSRLFYARKALRDAFSAQDGCGWRQ